jgi:hypothetical protein
MSMSWRRKAWGRAAGFQAAQRHRIAKGASQTQQWVHWAREQFGPAPHAIGRMEVAQG